LGFEAQPVAFEPKAVRGNRRGSVRRLSDRRERPVGEHGSIEPSEPDREQLVPQALDEACRCNSVVALALHWEQPGVARAGDERTVPVTDPVAFDRERGRVGVRNDLAAPVGGDPDDPLSVPAVSVPERFERARIQAEPRDEMTQRPRAIRHEEKSALLLDHPRVLTIEAVGRRQRLVNHVSPRAAPEDSLRIGSDTAREHAKRLGFGAADLGPLEVHARAVSRPRLEKDLEACRVNPPDGFAAVADTTGGVLVAHAVATTTGVRKATGKTSREKRDAPVATNRVAGDSCADEAHGAPVRAG
jgi:hypothetical protein